jgi:glucose/arabinose dehydrogenase
VIGRAALPVVAAILVTVACSRADPQPVDSPYAAVIPAVIATELAVPWGVAFLPDGSALVTERDTGVVRRLSGSGDNSQVGAISGVAARGEAGLMGLAVSPGFATDQTIYAYFTTSVDNRVVRLRFDGRALSEPQPILTGIPAGRIHDGGRLAFGPDGKLYVTTGEAGNRRLAQDRSSLGGKILRLNPDGTIPADNPDPSSPIWSFGHRNIQGLAWDPQGRLWATEYGANTWDELNLIQPGGNYGWPDAEGRAGVSGMIDPHIQWPTDAASPSGLAYFAGSLWVASLRGQRLWQIPVGADGALADPVGLFVGEYGRLRTVVATPAGTLWFTTSNRDGRGSARDGDDRILELRP